MFKGLEKTLYPTGSAFKVIQGSNREKIHDSIHTTYDDMQTTVESFLNGLFSDNNDITNEELSFLEWVYGVYYKDVVSGQERKQRVLDKIRYPNGKLYRQSAAYIQSVLNEFGFDVNVYENTDGVIPSFLFSDEHLRHSFDVQHGFNTQHGVLSLNVIANSVEPNESILINDSGIWATFFISGNSIEEPADILLTREREFRQLVLKLKPAHTVAILNIAFTSEEGDFNNDFNNDFLI